MLILSHDVALIAASALSLSLLRRDALQLFPAAHVHALPITEGRPYVPFEYTVL